MTNGIGAGSGLTAGEPQARFQALVEASNDAVFRLNPDWTRIEVLGRAFIYIDWGAGKDWLECYVPPADRQRVAAAIADAIRDRRRFEMTHQVIRADGSQGWGITRAVPVFNPDGSIVEWLGTAKEVPGGAAAEAPEGCSTDAFIASMSHTLRSPITVIMGMTDLALRGATHPRQVDQLTKVVAATERLLRIINDVVDISKAAVGRLTLDQLDFSMDEWVEKQVSPLGQKAGNAGLGFRIELAPGLNLRRFNGDPLRLGQILGNLINHAIKSTPHGSISVRGALIEEGDGHATLRWEVTDTGASIDRNEKYPLLDARASQFRGDGASVESPELELMLCRRLIALMGGNLGVERLPDQVFSVWFTVRLATADGVPTNDR